LHYYQFHIGDYRKDTAHLTPIEHYIYRSLIDWYFLDEKPITPITQSVIRRLGLVIENTINVENVLADFFVLHDDGYHHKRIDQELEEYQAMCGKNYINGIKGGRPRKTQSVTDGNPLVTQINPELTLTSNHKPVTINQINTNTMSPPATPKADAIQYEEIVNLYHQTLPMCPKVVMLTAKRKGQIAARWKSGVLPDLETWKEYFEFVSKSDFLTGKTDPVNGHKRFVANLEWLTNESNFVKTWENKYHGQI
jgi:uncharacterized protein YdaU (DUF1376 family)